MRPSTSTLLASAALLALGASAQIDGQIASLDSADSYCFFLPPMVGGDIAANEDAAIAFCNKANPKAPGAKVFPDGFVLTAHWATGDGWVQITGQIEPSKYSLNPCDAGGQYDIRAPVGATCAGYGYFVNVIEPIDGVYGMRCCQNKADCVVSKSTYGVRVIFGDNWDYSGPHPDGNLPAAANCVDGVLPGGASSTAPVSSPTVSAPASASASATPSLAPNATTSAVTSPIANSTSSASPTATTKPASAGSSNKAMIVASAVLASAVGLFLA
ncbi:hypothetical protein EMPS_03130 [Entomortierella parvispora]|uniref:Uncharacterized protein n=1 Tax=Entomortierella parvispora TaxID=205924 RepID=A0A9P3LUL1_9FUNG|nr:hypothetical protein EMPS_03130 [Entomortierella parvispora]